MASSEDYGGDALGGIGEGASGSERMPGESMEAYIARLTAMGMWGGEMSGQRQVGGGGFLSGYDKPRSAGQTSDTGSGRTTGGVLGEGASIANVLGGPDAQRIAAQINANGGQSGGGPGLAGSGLPGGEGKRSAGPAGFSMMSGGIGGSSDAQDGRGYGILGEPDNSGSPVRPSPTGGGGTQDPVKHNVLAELLGKSGGGSGGAPGSNIPGMIDRGTGVFNDPIYQSFAPQRRMGRNVLSDYLDQIAYVKPAYRNQPNPYGVSPDTFNNGSAARNYLDQLMRSRGGR